MFVVAGQYRVVAPIAEGGMGVVYSAVHEGSGDRVALKLLHQDAAADPDVVTRFIQEARLTSALTSPYVARVFDAGTDDASGLPFIAMEYLDGEDLRKVLSREKRLPVDLVLLIAAHVAAGLAEAHGAGIIHRDVKPANVVLCTNPDGEMIAKVVDFGIAKSAEAEGPILTRTGDFVGSLPYMSPEQLDGKRADERTDVWSLGILMYEALTGERPSGSEAAVAAIVSRVCLRDIPPVSSVAPWVPEPVSALLQTALRRPREERFPTMRAMHEALVSLLPGGAQASETASATKVLEPIEQELDPTRVMPPIVPIVPPPIAPIAPMEGMPLPPSQVPTVRTHSTRLGPFMVAMALATILFIALVVGFQQRGRADVPLREGTQPPVFVPMNPPTQAPTAAPAPTPTETSTAVVEEIPPTPSVAPSVPPVSRTAKPGVRHKPAPPPAPAPAPRTKGPLETM